MFAWGYDFFGQLGDGGESNSNVAKQIAGLSNVVQISAGDYHALALLGIVIHFLLLEFSMFALF